MTVGGGNKITLTNPLDEYYFLWAIGLSAQFVNGFAGFIDYEAVEGLDTITSGEVSFGLRYETRFK